MSFCYPTVVEVAIVIVDYTTVCDSVESYVYTVLCRFGNPTVGKVAIAIMGLIVC